MNYLRWLLWWPVEERVYDAADSFIVELGWHLDPRASQLAGRAASGNRRLIGQLGHGGRPV